MNTVLTQVLKEFVSESWYFPQIRVVDAVEILIITFLFYQIILWIKNTKAWMLLRGILVVALFILVAAIFKMYTILWIAQNSLPVMATAVVIIFQPELRRLLERMGSKTFPSFGSKPLETLGMDNVISQTIAACTQLSSTKTGALIVFERGVTLDEQMRSGTTVNSDVTAELLKNIFYPKAPLHDGAVVIRDGRIAAAGCVLPLTSNTNLSPDLGTRHRAGIGMSEHSDAVVVIVSEETGGISIAVDGMLKRRLSAETFEAILRSELLPEEEQQRRRWDVFVDFVKKLNPLRRENRYDKKDDNQQNHQQ